MDAKKNCGAACSIYKYLGVLLFGSALEKWQLNFIAKRVTPLFSFSPFFLVTQAPSKIHSAYTEH